MPNTSLWLSCFFLLHCCNAARVKKTVTDHLDSRQQQHLGIGSVLHGRYRLERFVPPVAPRWGRPGVLPGNHDPQSKMVFVPAVSLKPRDRRHGLDRLRMVVSTKFGQPRIVNNITQTDSQGEYFQVDDFLRHLSDLASEGQDVPPTGVEFRGKAMKRLGKGKFGEVWEATDLETGAQVVVKFFMNEGSYLTWNDAGKIRKWLMLKSIEETKIVQKMVTEGKQLYPSGASHICECLGEHIAEGIANPTSSMYTVWEVAGSTDLTSLKLPEKLDERIQAARTITKQVAEVLVLLSMFDPPIIHHDLKPDNIMIKGSIDEGFDVKVIDFGCFIPASEEMKTSITMGDLKYMPPEYMWENAYSDPPSSFDMWSLGLIHMQLLCPDYTPEHWFPSDGSSPTAASVMQGLQIHCRELSYHNNLFLVAKDLDLIMSCLNVDPIQRPRPSTMVETLTALLAGEGSHLEPSHLEHEQTTFKKGEFVKMLINREWVHSVVTEAAAEYYDIRVCDETGCVIHPDVEPARVKSLGYSLQSDVRDTRPGEWIFADF